MTREGRPPLDPDRWARAEALFHEASELPAVRVDAFLAQACAGDDELRRVVGRLLSADATGDALVDRSIEDLATPLLDLDETARVADMPAGTRVGRYRLLDVLGSGGMGTVYRAERADGAYDRVVALKVVRAGLLVGETESRFRREREILAKLIHPGIATLLDGGVGDEGLPFLAMELVEGDSITEYADARGLDVRARVGLLIQVAEAVDYAHRNLVVHRDLKPSNILVTEPGSVKLLDFGIARLLVDESTSEPRTRTGLMLMTPDYAAPEQILGEPVTTAVDVYAMGSVLYELLAGRRPFGAVASSWSELHRVVDEAPKAPSRVESLDRAARRALGGDLDTIVLKALHKDPLRRYASARELADDLRRFLDGLPVRARRDSVGYRMSKLVRRNPAASLISAALVAAVTLGVAGTLWQARAARQEAERRDAVAEFMISVFEGADPDLTPGESVTALELLEAGLARVDSLDGGPAVRVDLLVLLGRLFDKLGHYDRSDPVLRQAVSEALATLPPGDPAVANARDALGQQLAVIGDPQEAERLLREALAGRASDGSPPETIVSTQTSLALALRRLGEYGAAAELYESAIEGSLSRAGDSLSISSELLGLGQVRQFQARHAEAEVLFRTVARQRRAAGVEDTQLAHALHDLGVLLAELERNDEALALHEETLALWRRLFPDGHPEIPRSMEAIARVLEREGRWAEADELYREAIAGWSELYGEGHTQIAALRVNQANLRYFEGDFDAAAEAYREGIRIWRAGSELVLLGAALRNLGVIERERGDYVAADTLFAEALELRRELNGDASLQVAEAWSAIAGLRNREGRPAEAETSARAALERYRALPETSRRLILHAEMELGEALATLQRYDEAETVLERVHAGFAEILNDADAQRGRSGLWLGIAVAASGDADRARELIDAALPLLEAGLGPGAPETSRARAELARLSG